MLGVDVRGAALSVSGGGLDGPSSCADVRASDRFEVLIFCEVRLCCSNLRGSGPSSAVGSRSTDESVSDSTCSV